MNDSDILSIKQRFGIIGNSTLLNHAITVASQVAPTDMSVLITGESGSGKESFSKIIHHLSPRKHNQFIAINCGSIPEGTIDSELFGHEKGSFTGAHEARKGYFEVTVFNDRKKLGIHTNKDYINAPDSYFLLYTGRNVEIIPFERLVLPANSQLHGFIYSLQPHLG